MEKEEIIERVNRASRIDDLIFKSGDETLSNRFDKQEIDMVEPSDRTIEISTRVYSWIAYSLIYKAREDRSICLKAIEDRFNDITLSLTGCRDTLDKAIEVVKSFILSKRRVLLKEMIEILIKVAIYSLSSDEKSLKENNKIYKKNKEQITNQITLFVRALYHTYLKRKDVHIESFDLSLEDVDEFLLISDGMLLLSTWQNAFTVSGFKRVIKESLDHHYPTSFKKTDITSVGLIYFSKDILVVYNL